MLELFGHETATAFNPDSGIATAISGQFDVVLVDIGLPGCNGADCATQIRASRSGITCILMTGYSADTLHHMGIGTGDLATLRKPIRPADLQSLLAG